MPASALGDREGSWLRLRDRGAIQPHQHLRLTNRLIRSARALRMKPVEPSRAWGALQGEIVSPGGGRWEDGGRSPPGWGRVRERHRPAFRGISEAGQHSIVV